MPCRRPLLRYFFRSAPVPSRGDALSSPSAPCSVWLTNNGPEGRHRGLPLRRPDRRADTGVCPYADRTGGASRGSPLRGTAARHELQLLITRLA